MLPDYPELKAELKGILADFMYERHRHYLGPLSEVPVVLRPEGRGSTQVREEADSERETVFEELSETLSIETAELPTLALPEILTRFDDLAKRMAEKQARALYDRMGAILEDAGQVVAGQGRRMDAELMLEALRIIHVDFDEQGRPRLPQIHLHPDLKAAAQAAIVKLETDPALRGQMKQLLQEKRLEFHVREADRRLVG